jgi:hypothetical protein
MVARVGDQGSGVLSAPEECRVNIHAYDGIIQPKFQRITGSKSNCSKKI